MGVNRQLFETPLRMVGQQNIIAKDSLLILPTTYQQLSKVSLFSIPFHFSEICSPEIVTYCK